VNLRTAGRADAPETPGVTTVPGDQLDSLITRVRINGVEWRVTLSILIAPMPVSARCIAGYLKLDYGVVKRVVRGLVAWRILERTADSPQFKRALEITGQSAQRRRQGDRGGRAGPSDRRRAWLPEHSGIRCRRLFFGLQAHLEELNPSSEGRNLIVAKFGV
jgi:hypothetical protein